jgi:hypothetical protein
VPEETLTPTTNLKRLVIFGMAGCVGMLMAYFIFPSSIYFEQWLEFPSPPAGTVQLLTFKQDVGYQLIGRTANGETYVYQFYEG